MTNDNSALRTKEEMLAEMETASPEERAFTEKMIAAREQFDELVTPIITAMLDAAQPKDGDPKAVMNDDAMAVAEGMKQSMTGHLGKLVTIVGVGTDGEDGKNLLQEGVSQTVHALIANVKITVEELAALQSKRGATNG